MGNHDGIRAGAAPEWAPAPLILKQCLTANDARDPSKLIGSISTPGATGCSYTERNYSDSTFRFALDCSGTFGIKSRGSVTFSATQFGGEITAIGTVAGQTTEFHNKVAGTRVGDCSVQLVVLYRQNRTLQRMHVSGNFFKGVRPLRFVTGVPRGAGVRKIVVP